MIIGIVIGVIFLFLLIFLAIFILRRRTLKNVALEHKEPQEIVVAEPGRQNKWYGR